MASDAPPGLRESVIFTGNVEDFRNMFQCLPAGDGDWLLQATKDELSHCNWSRAKQRHFFAVDEITVDHLLTPAAKDRLLHYKDMRPLGHQHAGRPDLKIAHGRTEPWPRTRSSSP